MLTYNIFEVTSLSPADRSTAALRRRVRAVRPDRRRIAVAGRDDPAGQRAIDRILEAADSAWCGASSASTGSASWVSITYRFSRDVTMRWRTVPITVATCSAEYRPMATAAGATIPASPSAQLSAGVSTKGMARSTFAPSSTVSVVFDHCHPCHTRTPEIVSSASGRAESVTSARGLLPSGPCQKPPPIAPPLPTTTTS